MKSLIIFSMLFSSFQVMAQQQDNTRVRASKTWQRYFTPANQKNTYDFEGIVKLKGCSGAIVILHGNCAE